MNQFDFAVLVVIVCAVAIAAAIPLVAFLVTR